MPMPDWLISTLQTLPWLFAVVFGIGLPWALVVLPRVDWRDRVMVVCLSLAFGPALLTLWMFILGTLGQNDDPVAGDTLNPMQTTIINHVGGESLMRPDLIVFGLLVIALIGWGLAWRKLRTTEPAMTMHVPLAPDEKVLIGLIALATFARWIIQSWLPFGSWDPLWVYGFQGRIYTLVGYIPADIGYYPQFLPLQYGFGQIITGGIDDHAARAALPLAQIGSILATYLLGSRLFNRRAGIIAAALWALYPHMGYWTRVGDLEIPLTFAMTGTIAFFLMAWHQPDVFLRRRYAMIAGLFFGIAMWTKPTAGAFILGVVLVVVVAFMRVRADWRVWWPRFEVALITGLACIPLGALWYGRNIIIGHDAILFPPSYWQTQAMRCGAEFGWPLLALTVLLGYLYLAPQKARPNALMIGIGVLLVALGVAPTIVNPARMGLLEWGAFLTGVAVLAVTLWRYAKQHMSETGFHQLECVGWAWLIALPYFVTWFYSYSYHYRLSFAIVPVMLLPTAVILAAWFKPERIAAWQFPKRLAYAGLLLVLCAPGVAIAVYDEGLGWDWLWTIPPEDDYSKAGLLGVVNVLEQYDATHDEPLVVIAPGMQPLPFFFPEADIRVVETPREINQLAGVTHFVNNHVAYLEYERDGDVAPFNNQLLASLPREAISTLVARFQDPSFFYEVYELHTDQRFEQPEVAITPEDEVIFGDIARLVGYNINTDAFGQGVSLELVWEALAPTMQDYTIYVHFFREGEPDNLWAGWDGPVRYWDLSHYSTLFWDAGEYIVDRRMLFLQNPDTPAGDDYRIRVGFYHPETNERLPVQMGDQTSDGYTLEMSFTVP